MWRPISPYPALISLVVGSLCSFAVTSVAAQGGDALFLPVVHALPITSLQVTTAEDELNSDGDCSLREAIQATNTDQVVDNCLVNDATDLILLPAGNYTLTLAGAHEDANLTGDLDITGTLTISAVGGISMINGNQLDRVLNTLPHSQVTLHQITVYNGKTPNGAASATGRGEDSDNGGGIFNSGILTLTASTVTNNRTGDGGAGNNDGINLGSSGGNAGAGGAIFNAGVLHLRNSQILHNRTGNGGPNGLWGCSRGAASQSGAGGGLLNEQGSTVTIVASTFADNHTGQGGTCIDPPGILGGSGAKGGAIANFGTMRLSQSTLHSNGSSAGGSVGGSHSIGGSGGAGGGIFNNGTLQVSNSTISGNRTGSGGSGGYLGGSGGAGAGLATLTPVTLSNVTLSANQSGSGGAGANQLQARGGYGGGVYAESPVTLSESLIGGNSSTEPGADCTGLLKTYWMNLLQDPTNCAVIQVGIGAVIHKDPLLGPLADNGGTTWTHALKAGSPALDVASCQSAGGSTAMQDQRGVARPQGAGCDLGAYES